MSNTRSPRWMEPAPTERTSIRRQDSLGLCSGGTIAQARDRAQQAADTITRWARDWKMRLAGSKTQALVLSQRYQDARDFHIWVDGAKVQGARHLHLLGVTLDRQLHMGEHCARLRRKVKPRIAQLRKLTGRLWGLEEPQLRTIANGYVRGAMEFAAAAWLPAASETHVELLEREMRAAVRANHWLPRQYPKGPPPGRGRPGFSLCAPRGAGSKTGLRGGIPAEEDPLRAVEEGTAPRRLLTTTGWRDVGGRALERAGVQGVPVEERLHITLPPWIDGSGVSIRPDTG